MSSTTKDKSNKKKAEQPKNDFFKDMEQIGLGLLKALFTPEQPQPPAPPVIHVYIVRTSRKKGVIRRFLNYLW